MFIFLFVEGAKKPEQMERKCREYQSLMPRYCVIEVRFLGAGVGRRERMALWSVELGVLSSGRPRVEVLNCECQLVMRFVGKRGDIQ